MNQSIRIGIFLFIGIIFLSAKDIRGLQNAFYQEVILDNIYKERFHVFLEKTCPQSTPKCENKLVSKLKDDISVDNDAELKMLHDRRMEKLFIHESYWKRLEDFLTSKRYPFTKSQFVTFIDLSKQYLILLLWHEDHQAFYMIGNDLISSGNIEREVSVANGDDHYLKTPTGLFTIKSGWRSEGKVLEDGITMPYGRKNRFVFYFGKQKSVRYHTLDDNGTKIKDKNLWYLIDDELAFAVHAHKSGLYFGEPFSHGCVRMSNELNLFLDNNLVLHKNFLDETTWISTSANPPAEPKNYELAGEYIIVVDEI